MKKQILLVFLALTTAAFCYSQCDNKIILSAKGAERLNGQDEVQGKDERLTTIVYDTKVISITNEDFTLAGKIDSANCNWKTPFKEGKTILMVTITRANGEELTSKLTIEGKDGKLILLAEFDDPTANKLRFLLDKFEETK